MTDQPAPDDSPELESKQSVIALRLFFVYLLAYAGFMGLAAFSPRLMAQPLLWGVNVAIIYGLGLIAGAVILALVYMLLCHRAAVSHHQSQATQRGGSRT